VSEDRSTRLTDEALGRSGLADMRPAFRKLLLRLKRTDSAGFEEATRRYREELEPSVAAGEVDPIVVWLDYGMWLAGQLAPGQAMAIDRTGRARPCSSQVSPDFSDLLLHVPDDDRQGPILVAEPGEPSEAQRATLGLLVH
jgi:hypothetical protein